METIKTLGSRSRLIYYPELAWFLPENSALHTREEVNSLIEGHCHKLKCLALFFDHVILPPGSLLTGFPIVRGVLKDIDMLGLMEAGVVTTTFWAWCRDSEDFIPAKLEYMTDITGTPFEIDEATKRAFEIIRPHARDVTQQNVWTKGQMFQFLDDNADVIRLNYGQEALSRLMDIAKRSEYSEQVPYSLEKFALLLRRDGTLPHRLKKETKRKCWSFYFDAGVIGNYCVRYPLIEVDHKATKRLTYNNTLGIFFSPNFIHTFLQACGISMAHRILYLTYKDILELRGTNGWKEFTNVYFDIAASLSATLEETLTLSERQKLFREGETERLRLLTRDELLTSRFGRLDKPLNDMAEFLIEAGSFAGVPFLRFLTRKFHLQQKVEDFALMLRSPVFVDVRDKLNDKLQNVNTG